MRGFNAEVRRALKDLPHSQDIAPELQKDVDIGAMLPAREFQPSDMQHQLFTRRIPVREERPSGWRTRVADHATESGVNLATWQLDALRHDTVDCLVWIVLQLQGADYLHMWKRDVKRAFKRLLVSLPIWTSQVPSGSMQVRCTRRLMWACPTGPRALAMHGIG